MTSIAFDTLQFVKTLENAGFDGKKAEAVSRVFKEAQQEAGVVTKTDIAPIESELREAELRIGNELTAFRGEINSEFTAIRGEIGSVKNKIDWMMLLVIIAIVSPFLERLFV